MALQNDGNGMDVGPPSGEPGHIKKQHRWPWIVAGVFVVLIAVFIVRDRTLHGPLPFDRARWDAEPKDGLDDTRGRLADGLLASRTLIGKSRVEVVALLGEPPPTDYFDEYDMVYWLGADRGWVPIDSEWLVMRLDLNRRVSEARIVVD
jgi:hypothetical protein